VTDTESSKPKWPKEYYATKYECSLRHLRKVSPYKARKLGVLGWRKWDLEANVLDTVKPQA
jgi:hypothetical protein